MEQKEDIIRKEKNKAEEIHEGTVEFMVHCSECLKLSFLLCS